MSKTVFVEAKAAFEHAGAAFSAGVHRLDADIAKAMVKAEQAVWFKKPAPKADKTPAPKDEKSGKPADDDPKKD